MRLRLEGNAVKHEPVAALETDCDGCAVLPQPQHAQGALQTEAPLPRVSPDRKITSCGALQGNPRQNLPILISLNKRRR